MRAREETACPPAAERTAPGRPRTLPFRPPVRVWERLARAAAQPLFLGGIGADACVLLSPRVASWPPAASAWCWGWPGQPHTTPEGWRASGAARWHHLLRGARGEVVAARGPGWCRAVAVASPRGTIAPSMAVARTLVLPGHWILRSQAPGVLPVPFSPTTARALLGRIPLHFGWF